MRTLFGDILCESLFALNESEVTNDMIVRVMDEHRRVIISYHSNGEDNNTGPRLIEIYAYGVTTAGNPVIRAFQPYGDTTSYAPNWKYFLLNRISSWKDTGQTFDTPPEERYPGVGKFNPDNDKTMAYVYKITTFDGYGDETTPADNTTATGPKTKADLVNNKPVYKTDTEKQIDSLRKQLERPITLDDLLGTRKSTADGTQKQEPIPTPHGPKTTDDVSQPEQPESDEPNPSNKEVRTMSYPDFIKNIRDKDSVFKTDTERQMDKLRKNLENPKKIDLDRINKH